jgi:hypothetical protein
MHRDRAPSRGAVVAGRALSGLVILLLAADGVFKLIGPAPVMATFEQMGLPVQLAPLLGWLELACTALHALPRTAVPGAILLTGFLGGAVAAHLRLLDPWFSHTLFPVYIGAFAWAGLLLRDPRVRALLSGSAPFAAAPR